MMTTTTATTTTTTTKTTSSSCSSFSSAKTCMYTQPTPADNPPSGFVERPLIRVCAPKPKLKLQVVHGGPALLNECYAWELQLHANGDDVKGGTVTLAYMADIEVCRQGEPHPPPPPGEPHPPNAFSFGSIAPDSTHTISLHLRCQRAGRHRLPLRVAYASHLADGLQVWHPFDLNVVLPFDVQLSATDTISWTKPKVRHLSGLRPNLLFGVALQQRKCERGDPSDGLEDAGG